MVRENFSFGTKSYKMAEGKEFASSLYKKLISLRLQSYKDDSQFKQRITSGLATLKHHQNANPDTFLSYIPIDKIHTETQQIITDEKIPFQHALSKSLLKWFKEDFFTWVNTLPCSSCGKETENVGAGIPSEDDLLHGGKRVELHKCKTCSIITRFPRYNNAEKLMETRKGRCGEWANCFTMICRVMGLETRYVLDFEDHVWTEVYSDDQNRWIHMDSCENCFDEPLLYEKGWGKKLSYVIGFSDYEVKDISEKYTMDFNSLVAKRVLATEAQVRNYLEQITRELRGALSPSYLVELNERDQRELNLSLLLLNGYDKDWSQLQTRQSGSLEWRTQRGEMGSK
jgi:peptide-N4-(N-acetyl-beta-glucosaminyl)asparagine amidase